MEIAEMLLEIYQADWGNHADIAIGYLLNKNDKNEINTLSIAIKYLDE